AEAVGVGVAAADVAPGMVGVGNAGHVGIFEHTQAAAGHGTQFAGINKEDLVFALAVLTIAAVAVLAQNKDTGRHAGGQEQFVGHLQHAVYHALLYHVLAHVLFAGASGGHGAVGHHHARRAALREVVPQRLEPHVIGVTRRRKSIFGPE